MGIAARLSAAVRAMRPVSPPTVPAVREFAEPALFPLKASDPAEFGWTSGTFPAQGWLVDMMAAGGGPRVKAGGQPVTPELSLQVAAVFACARIRSLTVSTLPGCVVQKKDGKRVELTDHPLVEMLTCSPNGNQTSVEFMQAAQSAIDLRGNCYAVIERDSLNRPTAMQQFYPTHVVPRVGKTGEMYYDFPGDLRGVPQRDVLHVRNFSLDGRIGLSSVSLMARGIGVAIAAEHLAATTFGEGGRVPYWIEYPLPITDARKTDELRRSLVNSTKTGEPGILHSGMKYVQGGLSFDDLELLAIRKFQVTEICRMMGVPPHMVADLERSTNNNIEQQSIEFVVHHLRPVLVNWEQRINLTLLTERERAEGLRWKFNVDALLRGDSNARANFYKSLWNMGAFSADDIRSFEDMSPVDGGDTRWRPLNMVPLTDTESTGGKSPASDSPTGNGSLADENS